MKNILELKERLRGELDDEYFDESEIDDEIDDEMDDEIEDDDDIDVDNEEDVSHPDKSPMSFVRIDNQDKIKGRLNKLDFEINYKELSDKINEEVPGVIVSKIKARQIMDIIRKEMGF